MCSCDSDNWNGDHHVSKNEYNDIDGYNYSSINNEDWSVGDLSLCSCDSDDWNEDDKIEVK